MLNFKEVNRQADMSKSNKKNQKIFGLVNSFKRRFTHPQQSFTWLTQQFKINKNSCLFFVLTTSCAVIRRKHNALKQTFSFLLLGDAVPKKKKKTHPKKLKKLRKQPPTNICGATADPSITMDDMH